MALDFRFWILRRLDSGRTESMDRKRSGDSLVQDYPFFLSRNFQKTNVLLFLWRF